MPHLFYSKKTIDEIFLELKTNFNGLSENEAKNRLLKYGFNEIVVKKIRWFDILFRQIKNSMVFLLFAAAFISLLLKEFKDSLVIFFILLININLGFLQEYKSEKFLEKLKSYIVGKAKVKRDGKKKIINKRELVVGDLVILEPGDIIPADLRIVKSKNFMVNEAILTGESYPVLKDELVEKEISDLLKLRNIVFAGTTVVKGYAEGVVIATSKSALMNEIIALTSTIKHKSLFELDINKFSQFILKLVFFSLILIFFVNLIAKKGLIDFKELLLFNIALAVSVIPEALPLITTLTLSNGALKMAKKSVAIKRLSVIHDLGSLDVLCTDKTGTITQNILKIKEIFSFNKDKLLLNALLASDYLEKKESIDPFDVAIYQLADKGLKNELLNYSQIWLEPFDPTRRRVTTVVKKEDKYFLVSKGAPEEIIRLSDKIIKENNKIKDFTENEKRTEIKKISEIGYKGERVLAVAYKEIEEKEEYSISDEKNLIYLGFLSFSDPLKPTAKSAIEKAKDLGIQVKIITGDAKEVAEVVAKKIGLLKDKSEGKVFLGDELDKMSKEEFLKAVENGLVFARVNPLQKYKIIEALGKNHSVGFLGEGINDVPALKIAHVALVVDTGADVSKDVADIILLKKDLKVIVDGINEGRKIFTNVLKYIKYTLIGNFGNFYGMVIISLFIPFLPMLSTQILLVNLLTDLPLAAVATDNVSLREISKPKKYNFHELSFMCIFLGLISSIFYLIFFISFHKVDPDLLRTLWFIFGIFKEISIIFLVRTPYFFLKTCWPSFSLIGLCVLVLFLTILIPFTNIGHLFHFVRPPISSLSLILLLVICYAIITEVSKTIYYKYHKPN
jgi:Mg2+-importing ATPase